MSWQRSYLATAALLGERELEGTFAPDAHASAFEAELARATTREARARLLAREAAATLIDVAALGTTLPEPNRPMKGSS